MFFTRINKFFVLCAHTLASSVKRHPKLFSFCLFSACWLVASLIFYSRFPQSFWYANFFAEDGSVFLKNTLQGEAVKSIFTSFNGYFVVGIYICVFIAKAINYLLLGDHIFTLPQAFAITSYLILGLSAAICISFKRFIGTGTSLLLVILVATLPLPNTTHQVIGTIGNLKWTFFFIAFIVAINFLLRRTELRYRTAIPLGLILLICIYTNAYSYLALPVAGLPYLWELWIGRKNLKKSLRDIFKLQSFQILLAVCVLSVIQLIFVKLHGIPVIPGYLNTVFDWSRGIEILVGRTLIFGFIFPFWTHMNDLLVVTLAVAFIAAGARLLRGKDLYIFSASLLASMGASFLFIATRPGISGEFNSYLSTGPDHFFYAQNLIMYIPFVLLVIAIGKKIPHFRISHLPQIFSVTVLMLFFIANAVGNSLHDNNNLMDSYTGTFAQNLLKQCASSQAPLNIPLYPIGTGFTLELPKSDCDSVDRYIKSETKPIPVVVIDPTPIIIASSPYFHQTFTATENDLNGIRVILSTYGEKYIKRGYLLRLMDYTCNHMVREAEIGRELFDNYFYNIRFASIPESRNKTYCFTIQETVPGNSRLALRTATTDIYPKDTLTIKEGRQPTDIIFQPLYLETRH